MKPPESSTSRPTLGILAGGRASRLAGRDKAWLERDGVPQVVRWQRRFADEVAAVLVSANITLSNSRSSNSALSNSMLDRYRQAGLDAVADRHDGDLGPLAGLDALAAACRTPWLLTIPVDLVGVNECLLPTLESMGTANGAFAVDDDGPQPLVALWRVEALRPLVADAIREGDFAVHRLQLRLGMAAVRLEGVRFGNLNTPEDLAAAGIDHE
ncbi:molybdenum cofactor guanylyltransferase [Lysobacter alkalisoli]|uniref:Molybdenum cofactor guanylyltransferase n=2 Tax=Marilutibacter alkalisoli TaxID=2591633 RepID=A0A514BRR8_9GAMM|nr:molybdenum cofactor guanylyltransferase [Lysobacter alkalisoli]